MFLEQLEQAEMLDSAAASIRGARSGIGLAALLVGLMATSYDAAAFISSTEFGKEWARSPNYPTYKY